jgi:hypothetical protein
MTLRIRFTGTDSLHDSTPTTIIEAQTIAGQLSRWNQRVEIVVLDDQPKVVRVLEQFEPYSEEGAQILKSKVSF